MRYCWLPENVFPQESLWSLFQKFMAWNCCTPIEMWQCFNRTSYAYPTGNKSVLTSPAIDLLRFQRALRISSNQIDTSLLKYYLHHDENDILTSNSLRYCPECLAEGYHSPIQQIYFINECPFHNCQLTEVCTQCERSISLKYADSSSSKVFSCAHCQFQFIQQDKLLDNLLNNNRDIAYLNISRWLRKRLLIARNNRQSTPEWVGRGVSDARRRARIKLLPSIWADILGEEAPFKSQNTTERQLLATYASNKNEDYRSVYQAVILEILDFLSNHCKCIDAATRVWCPDIYYSKSTDRIQCIHAHAFIMWRMFCEGVEKPHKLVSTKEPLDVCTEMIRWFDESEHHSVVLKEILMSVYWECVSITRLWRRQGLFKFDLRYLEGRCLPFWYKNDDTSSLSVWISKQASWKVTTIDH